MNKQAEHYHYTIQGYDKFIKKGEKLSNAVEITVYTTTEEEALARAKKIVRKKFYRIYKAWECFEDHGLAQEIQITQLEIQNKMLKMH